MAENKTQPTERSVEDFLNDVDHETRKKDSFHLLQLMSELSGYEARMWGPSIVGFGEYHYKYDSGREGDFMRIGFAPRKSSLSLYLMPNLDGLEDKLERLGKHKIGRGCLYINKLADVDESVLKEVIEGALERMQKLYPEDM